MPLYLPNNSVFFSSPTRLEARYRISERQMIAGETGYIYVFFPGCGTEGYAYSVTMPVFWQYDNAVALTFNGFDNGTVIYEDGVWTDPAFFVTSAGVIVSVHFTVEGWLPIFNYGTWDVEYRLANSDGSVIPAILIDAPNLADDSGYPGGLPYAPVITPRKSVYTPLYVGTYFNWVDGEWRISATNDQRAISPSGVEWETDGSYEWGLGSGGAGMGDGYIWIVNDMAQHQVNFTTQYSPSLHPVGYDDPFSVDSEYWILEAAAYVDNKDRGMGSGSGIYFEDGVPFKIKVDLYTYTTDWYLRLWFNGGLQHSQQCGSNLVDGIATTMHIKVVHDPVDKKMYWYWKKGDDAWTEAADSPYTWSYQTIPTTVRPEVNWYDQLDLPFNPGDQLPGLIYYNVYSGADLTTYLGGYLQIDFSTLSCSGKGTAFDTLDMGYTILPSLIIGAYQGNNERADIVLHALTISATAEWQEASMTLPSWHMGGYEDTYDGYGLMTLPALTLTVEMDYVYSCIPMRPGLEIYSFVQGIPSDIPNEFKPYVLLYGSDYMEDLAETVFWGLS